MAAQGKKILVVDDDRDARRFLTVLLEDHGYVTVTAADGEDALAKIQEHKPDLITLDVAMPTSSGLRFYKTLRKLDGYREIPVVLVTGVAAASDEIVVPVASIRPPEGLVTKPVQPEHLLAVVERALEDKHGAG